MVFDPDGNGDRIWVLGGGSDTNNVWSSPDGKSWVQEIADSGHNVDWNAMMGHASAVFDDKIWIIGWDYSRDKNYRDYVWSSANGRSWSRGKRLPYAIVDSSILSYSNRLWILGGKHDLHEKTFSSATPAADWTTESSPPPTSRAFTAHRAVVFDNSIWMLGGMHGWATRIDDVWRMSASR